MYQATGSEANGYRFGAQVETPRNVTVCPLVSNGQHRLDYNASIAVKWTAKMLSGAFESPVSVEKQSADGT